MDALDRIERELVKSPLRGDIVFQHEDLEAVCRELRVARALVKPDKFDLAEGRRVRREIAEKMKVVKGGG